MASKTEIVKPEVVPELPVLPQKEVGDAIIELHRETEKFAPLLKQAEAMQVTNKTEYVAAGQLRAEIRALAKTGQFKLGQYLEVAKKVVNFLKIEISTHESAADQIDIVLTRKINDELTREKAAAAAEEKRVNEERRIANEKKAEEERIERERIAKETRDKRVAEIRAMQKRGEIGKREAAKLLKDAGAAEEAAKEQADADAEAARRNFQPVKVEPNVPTILGSRKTRVWKVEIVNEMALDRKWLMPDLTKINQEVRDIADAEKAEKAIHGIRVTFEDRN
jgi:hypothetical protein